MISNKTVTSLLAALVLPIAALAGEDINYTFLDMQYTNNGIDESYTETWSSTESLTVEFDGGGGFAALGSLALHDNWHIFTRYAATDVDLHMRTTVDNLNMTQSFAGDVNDWRIGFGFNIALTPNLDSVVQLAWDSRKVELGSVSIDDEAVSLDLDDDGFAIMAGLRGNIGEKFELNGHVQYSEVLSVDLAAETEEDVLDDDVLVGVGAVYHVNNIFSIGANVETGDSTAWGAFARVGFGRS